MHLGTRELAEYLVTSSTVASEALAMLPAEARQRMCNAVNEFAHTAYEHHLPPVRLGLRCGDYDIVVQLRDNPAGVHVLRIRPHEDPWHLDVSYA